VADHGRLAAELADDTRVVIGHLADGLVGEGLGVGDGLFDRVRVIRPARAHRRVAGLGEVLGPAIPAAGQQPEPVDEYDGRASARVGLLDLLRQWTVRAAGGFSHVNSHPPCGK
jgi:hypothetical protein